jgi:hypothetical protein
MIRVLLIGWLSVIYLLCQNYASGSVIVSSSNLTYCNIDTFICETLLTTNAKLTAPSADLSFFTLDNAALKVYFENITVSYATLPQMHDEKLIDGKLECATEVSCPGFWPWQHADDWPCDENDKFNDPALDPYKVSRVYDYANSENNCEYYGRAYVCYIYYLTDVTVYDMYYGFSSYVDQLHFIYKKKPYSVRLLQTIELPDMNFTFLGGEQWTFSFENTAILINQQNSQTLFKTINQLNVGPSMDPLKAGWWKGFPLVDFNFPAKPPFNTNNFAISRLDASSENNVIQFSISCPEDPTRKFDTELKTAAIIGYSSAPGQAGKILHYDIGIQDTAQVEINGFIVQLCVDYPTICVCNTLNPLICLEFEGYLQIRVGEKIREKAYLNQTKLYQQKACSNPLFGTSRVPAMVDVLIQGTGIIPKIDVSSCKPNVYLNYDTSTMYLKVNCSYLPCLINADTGLTMNVTLSDKEKRFEVDSTFQWVEVTCLRWNKKFYKNQAQNVTGENGDPEVENHLGEQHNAGGGNPISEAIEKIKNIGIKIFEFIKAPFEWLWDFLKDPLGFLKDLFAKLMQNILFWILMIFGGLVSLCINGFIFTIVVEIVSYQVYKYSTAYTALLTMGGMVIAKKVWTCFSAIRKNRAEKKRDEQYHLLEERLNRDYKV